MPAQKSEHLSAAGRRTASRKLTPAKTTYRAVGIRRIVVLPTAANRVNNIRLTAAKYFLKFSRQIPAPEPTPEPTPELARIQEAAHNVALPAHEVAAFLNVSDGGGVVDRYLDEAVDTAIAFQVSVSGPVADADEFAERMGYAAATSVADAAHLGEDDE